MIFRTAFLISAFAIPLSALPPTGGQEISSPIAAGSKFTYAALLQLVCPDLKVDPADASKATATQSVDIRELGKKPVDSELRTGDQITIESVKTVALQASPKGPRALVGFAVYSKDEETYSRNLAAFDLSAAPRLIDVVSVPGFPDDAGDFEGRLVLNKETEGYIFESYHSNSSQGYQISTVLFLHGDRFEKIADVGLLSSRGYDREQSIEQTVNISAQADAGRPYNSVVVQVTFKRLADEPDSQHRPLRKESKRYYTATYRWNPAAGRYTTLSKELEVLDAFNQKNN